MRRETLFFVREHHAARWPLSVLKPQLPVATVVWYLATNLRGMSLSLQVSVVVFYELVLKHLSYKSMLLLGMLLLLQWTNP